MVLSLAVVVVEPLAVVVALLIVSDASLRAGVEAENGQRGRGGIVSSLPSVVNYGETSR